MDCPSCRKEVMPDTFFCTWCGTYIPVPNKGEKANIFRRWVAWVIDPLIGVILYLIAVGIFGSMSEDLGTIMAVLFPLAYLVVFLMMLRNGVTPGKYLMGLRVINHQTGNIPGLWTMILREIIGRILSGLFFGLGYFWALFDKNSQAWHDKLAGTVVIKKA